MTPDTQTKIAEWRAKCAQGTMTPEEYREVIATLRAGRAGVSQPKAGSRARKSAAAQKPDGDDLLSELEGL